MINKNYSSGFHWRRTSWSKGITLHVWTVSLHWRTDRQQDDTKTSSRCVEWGRAEHAFHTDDDDDDDDQFWVWSFFHRTYCMFMCVSSAETSERSRSVNLYYRCWGLGVFFCYSGQKISNLVYFQCLLQTDPVVWRFQSSCRRFWMLMWFAAGIFSCSLSRHLFLFNLFSKK